MSLVPYNVVALSKNIIAGKGLNVLRYAPVYVKRPDGTTVEEIYASDEEGSSALTQPLYTDRNGELTFYIDAGEYDITIDGKEYRVSIAGDRYDTKIDITTDTSILEPKWAGCWCVFSAGIGIDMTMTINPVATTPQVQGSVWTLRNYNGNDVLIQADEDVYINPLGDLGGQSYVLKPNKTIELRYGGSDFYYLTEIESPLDYEITEYGFSVSAISDAAPQDVKYTLSVGRNLGTAYAPSVRVKGIGQDDDEEYFDEALATESYVNSVLVSDSEPVSTISTSTFNLDSADIAKHVRCTYNGAKTMTIRPESTHPQPADARYKITNRNLGDLSVTLGSGVTAVRAGSGSQYSTITVKYGSTLFLKRVAADTYDVEITSDNYGVGTNTSTLGGVSADYSDIMGCGFYSMPSGYNAGIVTLPSACPKIRVDQSSNLSAEILFVVPSSAGLDNGRVLGRDRTGATWNGFFEYMTSKNTVHLGYSPLYDQSITVSGITCNIKIWKGTNTACKDAFLLATISGTATSTITGASFPDTTVTSGYVLAPPNYGTDDYICIPIHTGGYGQAKTLVGSLDCIWSGGMKLTISNGAVFTNNVQLHLRYKTA